MTQIYFDRTGFWYFKLRKIARNALLNGTLQHSIVLLMVMLFNDTIEGSRQCTIVIRASAFSVNYRRRKVDVV